MEISERMLREVFLPPWVAGIREAGALGVMATYPEIDAVPVHGSEWILTRILRGELGFEGLVLSEGSGISTLIYEGLAANQKEAGELALRAGVDVGISYEKGYMQDLVASVRERRAHGTGRQGRAAHPAPENPARAVRKSLRRSRPGLRSSMSRTPGTGARAAREGIVLLKNAGSLLPLRKSLRSP